MTPEERMKLYQQLCLRLGDLTVKMEKFEEERKGLKAQIDKLLAEEMAEAQKAQQEAIKAKAEENQDKQQKNSASDTKPQAQAS